MTLFQETAAAGERGAGAPGGARRHLPPPAAPAALAPPRDAVPPSMRGLWPPRYKGAAVRPSARVGRQLTERKLPFTRPPARPLLCFATLQPGTAGGRARRTSGWPRDTERTVVPFRILGLWPHLRTLSVPSDFGGQGGYLGGAKILGQPPLISQRAAYRAVGARPWEPTLQAAYRIKGERRH